MGDIIAEMARLYIDDVCIEAYSLRLDVLKESGMKLSIEILLVGSGLLRDYAGEGRNPAPMGFGVYTELFKYSKCD